MPYINSVPMPSKTSEPFGISQSISTRTLRYLHRNLPEPHQASFLHRNPPEPHRVPAPETSGTLQGICTRTLRNLTRYLHRNPPKPHRTLQSLSRYLHEVSAPEPSGTSRGICTRTLRNLVRNLVLKLHQVAPELIWATVLLLGKTQRKKRNPETTADPFIFHAGVGDPRICDWKHPHFCTCLWCRCHHSQDGDRWPLASPKLFFALSWQRLLDSAELVLTLLDVPRNELWTCWKLGPYEKIVLLSVIFRLWA